MSQGIDPRWVPVQADQGIDPRWQPVASHASTQTGVMSDEAWAKLSSGEKMRNVLQWSGKALGGAFFGPAGVEAAESPKMTLASVAIPRAAPKVITWLGRRAYQGALKPTQATLNKMSGGGSDPEKISRLIDTADEHTINVSRGGFDKTDDIIEDLNDQIAAKIASSTATVGRREVSQRLADVVKRYKDQVTPLSDLREIAAKGREFISTNQARIPVQKAQSMKQGTYRALRGKWGEEKSAAVEAQKGLARGLKEEVAARVDVGGLNASETALLNLRTAMGGALRRTGNRDMFGLTDVIAATHNPQMLALTLAQRGPILGGLGLAGMKTGRALEGDALRAALMALLRGSGPEQEE